MYVTSMHPYKVDTKHCYLLESDWQEGSVTWNFPWKSPGGDFSKPPVFVNTNTQKNVWEEFDVTEAVLAMINNSKPNYGFIVIFPSTNDRSRAAYYRSSEYSDATMRPKLVISTDATGANIVQPDHTAGMQFIRRDNAVWLKVTGDLQKSVEVFTLNGQKIISFSMSGDTERYKMPLLLTPGMHIVNVKDGNTKIVSKLCYLNR